MNLILSPTDLGIPISGSLLDRFIHWASQVDRCSHTPGLQVPNARALPHTSPRRVVLMGCLGWPICVVWACRVCGLVLAGSRMGCGMGLSRLSPFVPCAGVGGGLRVSGVCGKGRGHAGGVPSL